MKRTLVYSMKVERKSQHCLVQLSWECAYQATQSFLCSVPAPDDHQRAESIDLGVTIKFQQISKLANTESVNNEDQLYFKLNYGNLTGNVKIMRFYS